MDKISEKEFGIICRGILEDRDKIIKHNPIGTDEEILLWMLMSVLISFLSLKENEIPCFPGTPNAQIYRVAVESILQNRMEPRFDPTQYLKLIKS